MSKLLVSSCTLCSPPPKGIKRCWWNFPMPFCISPLCWVGPDENASYQLWARLMLGATNLMYIQSSMDSTGRLLWMCTISTKWLRSWVIATSSRDASCCMSHLLHEKGVLLLPSRSSPNYPTPTRSPPRPNHSKRASGQTVPSFSCFLFCSAKHWA